MVDPPAAASRRALVFQWRSFGSRGGATVGAGIVVLGLAAAAFLWVRVDVGQLPELRVESASMAILDGSDVGRDLELLAEEAGPGPMRIGIEELPLIMDEPMKIAAALSAPRIRHHPEPLAYEDSSAQSMPESLREPWLVLPHVNEREFPLISPEVSVRTVPVLHPLLRIEADGMPNKLPEFELPPQVRTGADSLRFLVRLRPDGGVERAIGLVRDDEKLTEALELWFLRVKFPAAAESRWVPLVVTFANQIER